MTPKQANRELELKFAATAPDLARFKKAVNAAAANRRAWPKKDFISRYYDTPDMQMQKAGVAIRLRSTAGKIVQTVKAGKESRGGLMDRHEWEYPVSSETLDLDVLPPEAHSAMGDIDASTLDVIVEVRIERQTMMIRRVNPLGPDLVIEAVTDTGQVHAGGKSESFCECEMELIEGDVNAFLHVVSEIHTACPLALSSLTKAGRGYRLLDDAPPAAHRLPKFVLGADQTIHQALSEIYPACVANIVDNQDACLDGSDPEGVHQMRVSVRRLRTSLKVFRDHIDPARVSWMAEDLKWLGGALGPARDWDVYITEILAQVAGYGVDAGALDALRSAAEEKRRQAYDAVRETLRSERYAKLTFHLTAFVTAEGWLAMPLDPDDPLLKPLGESARGILSGPYRKLVKQAKGLAGQDMEARHEVRIRLKKLRYTVDFLRGVFPGNETRKYIKSLQTLQDQFGHLNDVAQALRLTAALTAPDKDGLTDDALILAGGLVKGWYAHALHETEKKLIGDWKAFAAHPPFWTKD
jgi:triphosphatase